jgi:hypothetical protein
MGDAIHDWIAPAAAHADEFLALELYLSLAHWAGQYFEKLPANDPSHLTTYTFVVYSFP